MVLPGPYKIQNMQDSLFDSIISALAHFVNNAYGLLFGLLTSVIGYFLPVKDIVNLLLLLFFLDVGFGYWAAHKLKGEKFSVKIIWSHTIPRMLVSIVLIAGAYMWDNTYSQEFLSTYKLIGWFLSGVLLYSIAQNGYKITSWKAFPDMANLIGDKVREKTGHEIPSDEAMNHINNINQQ